MNKRYAIFDMDGTLIDSMGYWRELAAEYLELNGIDRSRFTPEIAEIIKPLTVRDTGEVFNKLFGIQGTPESIGADINSIMNAHYENDIPLKPGVREYLTALRAHDVRMCIASATDKVLVRKCLTRLNIMDFFDFTISCEEVGAGKNKPDIYFEAAGRLGARPFEAAVYEDALFAGRTAKQGGFYVVGVYDRYAESGWTELSRLADECITDWRQALL